MDEFVKLLKENVLISSTIAVALVGTSCYMWATNQPLPPAMEAALMLVLGYFLGAKSQQVITAKVNKAAAE